MQLLLKANPYLTALFVEYPHSAATPTAHPWRVQSSTRNEICLTANEILLRKVKSDKPDEISLREVVVNQVVVLTVLNRQVN